MSLSNNKKLGKLNFFILLRQEMGEWLKYLYTQLIT